MRLSSLHAAIAALLPFLADASQTVLRMKTPPDGGALVYGRMDPIINPGKDSGHVHMVAGGNAFAISMGNQDALKATCTNAQVKKDRSNYWIPSLYFHKDGKFTSVKISYMNIYYKFERTTDKLVAWKPGFRMVSGNPFRRSPPNGPVEDVIHTGKGEIQSTHWTCPSDGSSPPRWPADSDGMHGIGVGAPRKPGDKQVPAVGAGFPNQNCDVMGSPLRADVHFPSCSNPNAKLDDYENNSAFPDGEEKCPPGWLHHPHLFLEVYWSTMDFAGQWETGQSTQPFVLANGDSTGYSLHGDFLSGWDPAALQQIIDHCDTGDGGMDGCPVGGGLSKEDIYTEEEIHSIAEKCTIKAHNPEKVLGVLDKLPGCNPITKASKADAPKTPASCSADQTPEVAETPNVAETSDVKTPNVAEKPDGKTADVAEKSDEKTPDVAGKTDVKAPNAEAEPAVKKQSAEPEAADGKDIQAVPVKQDGSSGDHQGGETGTGPSGWSHVGCFADPHGARVLSGASQNLFSGTNLMTVSKCTEFCEKKGFTVAGLEWKSECYCGNEAPSTKSDKCTEKCAGDKSQTCGGSGALSVYKSGAKKVKRHSHAAAHMARHRLHARSMRHDDE